MKRALLLLPLLGLLAAFAIACGGNSEFSVDEYFQQLEALRQNAEAGAADLDERAAVLEQQLAGEDSSLSEEDKVERVRDFVLEVTNLQRLHAGVAKAISPPPEAFNAHNAYANALLDRVELSESTLARLADVQSVAQARDVFRTYSRGDPALQGNVVATCLRLQAVARSEGSSVDLLCTEESVAGVPDGDFDAIVAVFVNDASSMEPVLSAGEQLIVIGYQDRLPAHNDIVVFSSPDGPPERFLVRRIVGLPGETIEMSGGDLLIDDLPLFESYIQEPALYALAAELIPAGRYFVLADQRNGSTDSHTFGPVPAEDIVGRVFIPAD